MKIKQSEKEIENAILDWLNIGGFFAWKVNNGSVYDVEKKTFRTKSKFDLPGQPDVTAIRGGVVFFIEIKSETGRQSDAQKAFELKLKQKGGNYLLVRSLEETRRLLGEEYVRA